MEESALLPSADYTLCLDSLLGRGGSESSGEQLYLHVSKPPKEGSRAHHILQALNQVSNRARAKVRVRARARG